MWTTKIIQLNNLSGGSKEIVVNFDDGRQSLDRHYNIDFINPDVNWLKKKIRDDIKLLDSINNFVDSLKIGDLVTPAEEEIIQPVFSNPDKTSTLTINGNI